MNCPNCAAPMALHPTRPCWQCAHCSTMVCPDPVADGVRVTAERGSDCPLCRRTLRRASLDDREMIEICERCKGILIGRRAFAVTITARRRSAHGREPVRVGSGVGEGDGRLALNRHESAALGNSQDPVRSPGAAVRWPA